MKLLLLPLLTIALPAAERVISFTSPSSLESVWTCPTAQPACRSSAMVFSHLDPSDTHVFSCRPHRVVPHADLVPGNDEIMSWIEAICGQGERRAGDPADLWTEQYVIDRFTAWGLSGITAEPVPLDRWLPGPCTARLQGAVGELAIPVFPFSSLSFTRDVSAPVLRYRSSSDLAAVPGAVVILDYRLNRIAFGPLIAAAVAVHDPDQDLAQTRHLIGMPHASDDAAVLSAILDARPAAVLVILANYFEEGQILGVHDPDDPTSTLRRIPCLWVGPQHAAAIETLLAGGPATAQIAVSATSAPVITHNIIGLLPGRSEELVQIASHHDGAFVSATEDAAGVALVLAQARYWSQVPAEERPHTLQFLITSGHLRGAQGEEAYLAAHPERIDRTVLDVHLETPAMEYDVIERRLQALGRPEPRALYTSLVPEIVAALQAGLLAEDLRRSLIIPDDAFTQPRCAAGRFFLAGIPVIGHIGGPPVYYFDHTDTLDKVDRQHLSAITRLMIRAIAATAGHQAASMRAARPALNLEVTWAVRPQFSR